MYKGHKKVIHNRINKNGQIYNIQHFPYFIKVAFFLLITFAYKILPTQRVNKMQGNKHSHALMVG
jgi:hypothetical protein